MHNRSFRICLLALLTLVAPAIARADCIEDPRKVTLDAGNVIQLKSYTCSAGPGQPAQIKVEFHRLSDLPASLLIGKTPSKLLTKTIGSPRIVENEVYKAYADFLKQFGLTQEAPRKDDILQSQTNISINPSADSKEADDLISAKKVRTLQGLYGPRDPSIYPAATEIAALRAKTIPDGVSYFYSVRCEGENDPPAGENLCKQADKARVTMNFWRPMGAADVKDYAKNLRAFNGLLKQAKKDPWSGAVPSGLKLAQYLAGEQWPEDFLFLIGNEKADACGDDQPGIFGWEFQYWPRAFFMDAVVVQNISKQPIRIGTVYGAKTSEPRLRLFKPSTDGAAGAALGDVAQTLAPGARLLYPTKISLFSNDGLDRTFDHAQSAQEVNKKRGASGFGGPADRHRAPALKDFVFGTELDVGGLQVDGRRVDFGKAGANFIDLTVSALVGSCPYLASWDAKEREWVDHGKVLHSAPTKEREYVETRVLPGFVSRFRLEEREPEVAFIDQVELVVALKTGASLTLKPDNPQLAARDENYLQLYWGDAVDLAFALPAHVAESDVTESRVSVTGYYRRYSSLIAENEAPATPNLRRASAFSGEWLAGGAMCPAPAAPRATLFRPL